MSINSVSLAVATVLLLAFFLFSVMLVIIPVEEARTQLAALVIHDDPTGGDCTTVGYWDQASLTCTLTQDLYQKILIGSDGVTLDGGGHMIVGSGPADPAQYVYGRDGGGDAISLDNRTGVTIRNLSIRQFDYGIRLEGSSGNTIENNNTYLMGLAGVSLHHSTDNIITGNDLSNPHISSSGICVGYASSRNEISNNVFSGNERGAFIHTTSDDSIVTGNNFNQNVWAVTIIETSSGAGFTENSFTNNSFAISIQNGSSGNTFSVNAISGNDTGVYIDAASGNTFYHNNFSLNQSHVSSDGVSQNSFTLPSPTGGNYWDDFDEPLEGCQDPADDGFCDAAYITPDITDSLPWVHPGGWSCGRPSLGIATQAPFWESMEDYNSGLLSVPFDISNHAADARNLRPTNATCTNGVVSISGIPAVLGDLNAGGHSSLVVKYMVPPGVSSFKTILYMSAEDTCMATYYFPGPSF